MLTKRLELHSELKAFYKSVYFQPPTNLEMSYPCIVYSKTGKDRKFSNNGLYLVKQEYQLTVIELNPDSEVADQIENHFDYCSITQYFNADGLNHTILNLYY